MRRAGEPFAGDVGAELSHRFRMPVIPVSISQLSGITGARRVARQRRQRIPVQWHGFVDDSPPEGDRSEPLVPRREPRAPPYAGYTKKSVERELEAKERLGRQGDKRAKPRSHFTKSAEPNIPVASNCGRACRRGSAKVSGFFLDRNRWFESVSLLR